MRDSSTSVSLECLAVSLRAARPVNDVMNQLSGRVSVSGPWRWAFSSEGQGPGAAQPNDVRAVVEGDRGHRGQTDQRGQDLPASGREGGTEAEKVKEIGQHLSCIINAFDLDQSAKQFYGRRKRGGRGDASPAVEKSVGTSRQKL